MSGRHVCPWWAGYFRPVRSASSGRIRRASFSRGQRGNDRRRAGSRNGLLHPGAGAPCRPGGPGRRRRRSAENDRRAQTAGGAGRPPRSHRRAGRAGVDVGARRVGGAVDFVLAFAVVHEIAFGGDVLRRSRARDEAGGPPAPGRARRSRQPGRVRQGTRARRRGGLTAVDRPNVAGSRAAVLQKP